MLRSRFVPGFAPTQGLGLTHSSFPQSLENFAGPEAQGCGISTEPSPQTKIQLLHSQIPAFRAPDGMFAQDFLQWCSGILWQKNECVHRKLYLLKKIIEFCDVVLKNLRFYAVFQIDSKHPP